MAFKAGAIYGEAKLGTSQWTSGLKSITKGAAIAGAAIAAAFTAAFMSSVKAANEFQKAMSNVSTLVDTTAINMQALTKSVLQLSPTLGNATEITKGLYQAFSAGAKTAKEAMDITVKSAMFAKAALTDTNTAVTILSGAVNAYGRETYSATQVSDIYFKTIKQGVITGEQLASSIGTSIPLYASAGIKLEELASGLAAMTKQNVNANVATTQLNALVNAFLKPSGEMVKALEDIGYQSGSTFLKAEGLAGALKLIEENTGGDAAEMGKLLPNIRALRGAMVLTGVGGKEFTATLKEMENATGATREAFEKQEKTFETFKNAIKNLMIPVGNIGKHFVDKLAVGATTAAQGMLAFIMSSQGMEVVAKIAGFVSGAFELLRGIIEPIFATVKSAITEVWDQLKESLADVFDEVTTGAGAMKLLAATVNLVTSSVIILGKTISFSIQLYADWVIAITESAKAIGTFFSILSKDVTWQDVKDQFKTAGQAFGQYGKNYVENISDIFNAIRGEVIEFSGETEDLTTELTGKINIAFESSGNYIRSNWSELLTGQEDFIGDILSGMQQLSGGLKVETETTTTDLEETWSDYWDELIENGEKTYDQLQYILENALDHNVITLQDYNRLSLEIWEDNWNKQIEKVELAYETINAITSTAFGGLAAIRSQYYENESAELDLWYQSELAKLDLDFKNKIISEDQYNTEKEALDQEAKDKRNELGRKVFAAEKANKLFGIASDAAAAIMGWWRAATRLGPIAGPIFASIMTGLTLTTSAIQSSLVRKQKFVPAMVKGGTTTGLTRINERGGEILNLPDGTVVVPNDISRQIAAASNSAPIISISFDGAVISNEMDLDIVTDNVIQKLGKEMRLAR